jgi:hypothetical protein
LWLRMAALFSRTKMEEDLSAEMQDHIERETNGISRMVIR